MKKKWRKLVETDQWRVDVLVVLLAIVHCSMDSIVMELAMYLLRAVSALDYKSEEESLLQVGVRPLGPGSDY